MSGPTRIKELRKEIESLCGNCDRPDKEQLGEIILSSMAFGFSVGLESPSADRPQGEWMQNENGTFSCSECRSWIPKEQRLYARYCLYCGTPMGKGLEDE